ncbi:phosphatidylinositol N-acetylglucosaminyltransferase subunit Q-like [Ptychodera flava]|uniref:phosphatidylinositol N-acetylglucosaminyltransferase subunit Q-like n=1 Tax=Ptychodera flava TaxID=63121 RepID=UPI003969E97B
MEENQAIRVFFPYDCLQSADGCLIGWRDLKRKLVCVVGVINQPCSRRSVNSYLTKMSVTRGGTTNFPVNILGYWNRGNQGIKRSHSPHDDLVQTENHWLEVETVAGSQDPPTCTLRGKWQDEPLLLVLYDQSKFLTSRLQYTEETNGIPNGIPKTSGNLSDIDCIFEMVNSCQSTVLSNGNTGELNIVHSQTHNGNGWKMWMLPMLLIYLVLITVFSVMVKIRGLLFPKRLFQYQLIQRLMRLPATGCQLIERCHHIHYIVTVHRQLNNADKSTHKTSMPFIRKGNILCSIILDVILGIALMLWLFNNDYPSILSSQLLQLLDVVGVELQKLLNWLMGVPAGLKLNSQLDEFLGKFFLYHIYLWLSYLKVLTPFMEAILWSIGLSGCLGVSVFLSLSMDFLSMLTFHIYCFYVYAARLYSLQLYGLASCWRLFRGKKLNVLRQRVDSCQYDVDQLFLGTILFTILLFLLPTTALYYVVFTSFRLVVLILDSVLSKTVMHLNTFPAFSLMLRVIQSSMLAGGVKFSVIERSQGHPLCLSIQVEPAPYSVVLKQGRLKKYDTWNNPASQSASLGNIGKRLLQGHLVYPWGGDKK